MTNEELLNVLKSVRGLFANTSPFYIRKLGAPITNADQSRIDAVFIAVDAAIASEGVSASPQPRCPECKSIKINRIYGFESLAVSMKEVTEFCVCRSCNHDGPISQFFAAAPAQEPERPGRTKLLMKFWSAMHLAGFAKDKEWDAQEKIHIEDLVKLMADAAAQEQPVENNHACKGNRTVAEPASTGEPPPKQMPSIAFKVAQKVIDAVYGSPEGQVLSIVAAYLETYATDWRAARPSEPSAHAEWRRQESCSECDGDGCAKCAPHTSADPQPLPCRTPGAVYHFKLAHSEQSRREILTLHVYMPQEISIAEEQAQSIEEKLHDACEGILSAYWPNTFAAAPQPVSGDAPKVDIRQKCVNFLCLRPDPKVDELADFVESLLRPDFPPASQTPEVEVTFSQGGTPGCAANPWASEASSISRQDESIDADMLAALKEQYRLQNIVGLDRAFRRKMQARANNMMREAIAKAEQKLATPASTARTDGWVSVEEKLPDDDSDVYAAIAWTHSPGVRKYIIHDCSYYEGGTGSGQKIFADCEGEEFEAKDVDFWIYKYRLAEQLPVPQAEPPKEEKL